jgi:hypothetical protein
MPPSDEAKDRASRIMHRVLGLFSDEVDADGNMATGSYLQSWAGRGVTLTMNEDGTATLTITEPEDDGGAIYIRKRFEAHWRADAALTVETWHPGAWESAFVRADS